MLTGKFLLSHHDFLHVSHLSFRLSTVIGRCRTPIHDALILINQSGILGKLSVARYNRLKELHPDFQHLHKPTDRQGPPPKNGRHPMSNSTFGFWLPHGLGQDPGLKEMLFQQSLDRGAAIETAFTKMEHMRWRVFSITLRWVDLDDRNIDILAAEEEWDEEIEDQEDDDSDTDFDGMFD